MVGITRVADVTGLDYLGVPVVTVARPNSRSIAVSMGKGLTLDAAKASGVMEAIEGWHAERPTIALSRASFNEIRLRGRTVDTSQLPRLQMSTYHPDRTLLWAAGVDLMSEHSVFVPYEMVHTDYTLPLPDGSGAFTLSSNGLASGNHLLEAVNHAICEVVERDALSLFYFRSKDERRGRQLNLESVEDSDCRGLLQRLAEANMTVAVWDATSDIGLPTFLCQIAESRPNPWLCTPRSEGSGCHSNRTVALLRAITEAAQMRLTVISGSRDGVLPGAYTHGQDPEVHRGVPKESGHRRFEECASFDNGTFEGDLEHLLTRLRSTGISQAILVDLTRPELRIPVARVIIPGLEGIHDAPGYRPGQRARRVMESS